MSETPLTCPSSPRLAETMAEVEDALLSRWPETRLEPSLDRIRAFVELLGEPARLRSGWLNGVKSLPVAYHR